MAAEQPLYQARIPIYPRTVKGRFRRLKWGILLLAYGVYYLLPWLPWERPAAPDQAVLFDIPGRSFFVFDLVIHPQDLFWLAGLLIVAAWLLFLVTGLLGRVFCGYFCFQTLWTDVFMLFERWIQGERPARIRLDKQPWHVRKFMLKGATHLAWLALACVTGLTFTLYWGYAPELIVDFVTGQAPFPAYATTLFLTATTYVMAGLAREQVCTFMCPYSRFQSVMIDRDTKIVSYDRARGEGAHGRAPLAAGAKTRAERQAKGLGDCIDCGYCVQVCPVGIDIRDGLQIQCIHCALCIDACDQVMDRLHWPRGLVRYASENELAGGKTRWLKLKNVGYAVALTLALGVIVWSMANPTLLDGSVNQVRQPLYVRLADGSIQNSYEIKLNNNSQQPLTLNVALRDLPAAILDTGQIEQVNLGPNRSLRLLARVRLPAERARRRDRHDFAFEITPVNAQQVEPMRLPGQFFSP